MPHIKLKSLTVSGVNVETSTIEFGEKLTIIAGPSNTGKTYIYKCINYVLGAKNTQENLPLDPKEEYDTIKLNISTNNGDLELTRKIYSETTNVDSKIHNIESGEYLITEKKGNKKTINKLFLKLINAPTDLKLPKNKKGDLASFTWRTIITAFMIDEEGADKSESIFTKRYNGTLYIASLIYLLTNDDLSEYKNDSEAEKIRKAKRNAIIEYIKNQRKGLELRKANLEKEFNVFKDNQPLEQTIKDLNSELNSINTSIDESTANNQSLTKSLIALQNRLSKNKITMSRYSELKDQYDADIGRLTFIVENELLVNENRVNTKCPFCENDMESHDHESYIEASQAELVKLVTNLNELENTKIELKNQIDDDTDLAKDYQEQLNEISTLLKKELIPQRKHIIEALRKHDEKLKIEVALKNIYEYDVSLGVDIEKYESEKPEEIKPFEAKTMIHKLLNESLTKKSNDILEKIGYSPLESIEFDHKTLDLVVNGKYKHTNGKGYKSFFNSVLAISLMKHISEFSLHNPGFFIYDSPLKGLKEADDIDYAERIRVGFFDYITNLKTDNQIILIENTEKGELPTIESNDNIKIYKFTQIENQGRYGFLLSVKRK